MTQHTVIHVAGIRKTYGRTVAVDEVSFDVQPGEIFGLIGPNGAGKTTTMECVEGLRTPDRGAISVLGLDPVAQTLRAAGADRRAAAGGAAPEADQGVGGGRPLGVALPERRSTAIACSSSSGLSDKRNAWFMTLSGGQKQRLFIALALINDPELVFLDELTTGLDPQARRAIWDLVRGIRERGKTVFLTTHLMEEAERLCDRVAIIDHGRIIDIGTPGRARAPALPGAHGRRRRPTTPAAPSAFGRSRTSTRSAARAQQVTIRGRGDDLVTEVIQCLAEHRIRVIDFRTELPTLEDVFLKLTGHSIRD